MVSTIEQNSILNLPFPNFGNSLSASTRGNMKYDFHLPINYESSRLNLGKWSVLSSAH